MKADRRPRHALLALAACLGLAGLPGTAEAAFRCGSRLVSEGDTTGTVRALCGAPAEVARTTLWRAPVIWRNGRPIRVPGDDIEVAVETWIYNLGPSRLLRRIRFEDNVATELDTLGYGYP